MEYFVSNITKSIKTTGARQTKFIRKMKKKKKGNKFAVSLAL